MLTRSAAILFFLFPPCLHAQLIDSLSGNNTSIQTANFQINENLDSIETFAAEEYQSLKSSYDSVSVITDFEINHLQAKIDSLQNLQLHTGVFNHKLDSIRRWKDEKIKSITTKVDSLKASVTKKIEALHLPPVLQEKANEFTSVIDKLDVSLPNTNLPLSFQKLDIGIPNVTDALKSQSLPGLDIPNTANLLDGKSIPGVPNVNVSSINLSDQVKGYQNQASEIPKDLDGVGKLAEEQATNISAVTDVQKELGQIDKVTDMAGSLQDQEELKKQLAQEAQKQAVDHFAGKEEQLKKAMESVSKYKQKFPTTSSLNDLPKKPPNEMRGKPLIERIVPGIAIQLQKKDDDVLTDFNLYFGYRFTRRFTSGAGWNQRVGYNTDHYGWSNDKTHIYGPRIFAEYKLNKGFSPRAELETMNTFVPPFVKKLPIDHGSREWVWGAFVGMKKDYKIMKKIKGTAMIMIRVFDPHHKSPYADVINARFGFEFPMKKKMKSS